MKILPEDAQARKEIPVYSGFVKYFPRAIAAVAAHSFEGGKQHNPNKPLFWDRTKSPDEKDALMRHILEGDWVHVAWRALANLEKELEEVEKVNQFVGDVNRSIIEATPMEKS